MSRSLLVVALLLSSSVLADELPPNACVGAVGDACTTDDGTPGTCIEERFEYVDTDGVTRSFTERICSPTVSSVQRSMLPWVGLGLAFLALCAALATRPPRSPRGVQLGA